MRTRFFVSLLSLVSLAGLAHAQTNRTFPISAFDLSQMEQGWGEPHANLSVEGHPLSIGGQTFTNGLGTHAESRFIIEVGGHATGFSAMVGVDDEVGAGRGSVVFKVLGDSNQVLWQSRELHGGDAPEAVNVDLAGVKQLTLAVDGGDNIDFDHADWADAKLVMTRGRPSVGSAIKEDAVILTPKASPKPRINSAKVFGVRPGAPFLFTIAATGDRPMTFSAKGLPKGLKLDPQTGRITGSLKEKGEYVVTLRAKNKLGRAEQKFKIICGPQIGLTPGAGLEQLELLRLRRHRRTRSRLPPTRWSPAASSITAGLTSTLTITGRSIASPRTRRCKARNAMPPGKSFPTRGFPT